MAKQGFEQFELLVALCLPVHEQQEPVLPVAVAVVGPHPVAPLEQVPGLIASPLACEASDRRKPDRTQLLDLVGRALLVSEVDQFDLWFRLAYPEKQLAPNDVAPLSFFQCVTPVLELRPYAQPSELTVVFIRVR